MPLNLEDELKHLSEVPPELRLDQRLARIEASALKIWEQQRLSWFTDHTAQRHSRRIIQLLGQTLEHLQTTPQALRRSELFILLAGAYLHDIGMQDFRLEGKPAESFTVEDYELIRKRHPERGRELVLQRSLSTDRGDFHVDLDDELQYLRPIALLAEGHGSVYFQSCLTEMGKLSAAPENLPIRGDALLSLLLIGDELDLHEDRASFPQELDLSPVAALHHHINHYVSRVEVRGGGEREASRYPRVRRSAE